MDNIDGVEILRHLADRRFQAEIIVLSGSDVRILESVTKLAHEHSLRLLGVLSKPLDIDKLYAMLLRLNSSSTIGLPAPRVGKLADLRLEDLREGMESGCATTVFQPIFSLKEQGVTGAECLLRWHDDSNGRVAPEIVVAAAEQHGLIVPLTVFVLNEALQALSKWSQQARDFSVSVNLSSQSLNELSLPDTLLQVVRAAGVDPRRITLEITETGLAADTATSLEVINRLSLRQFRLSIDDFGVGQSNLQKLKNMPFSELKVDKCFVQEAHEHPVAKAIVESSVRLAHAINMQVVAEGTETQDDLDFVIKAGCDQIQGYAIARPMSAESFLSWKSIWEAGHAAGYSRLVNR
jgi:EAL domain-containing protein (putative c-di-GMP-specific phosphodiesterase class I)